jgi:hypothetical protein
MIEKHTKRIRGMIFPMVKTMANTAMKNTINTTVMSTAIAVLLLAACSTGAVQTTAATADAYRATPEADSPAAGICASFKEATIRIVIRAWPGNVPDPRCIRVRTDQNLVIQNDTATAITFTLGRFHATLEPGEAYTIEPAVGEYLTPGAHSLHIEPYGGPEIFFESAK